jgi:hypothetical protein
MFRNDRTLFPKFFYKSEDYCNDSTCFVLEITECCKSRPNARKRRKEETMDDSVALVLGGSLPREQCCKTLFLSTGFVRTGKKKLAILG